MSDRRQNQAMQRFFEFVFNVPGDCFCFKWSISCFLETVEHMEGDKRWRSICSLGMATVTLGIMFLLGLSLCPIYYWSQIDEVIPLNNTKYINITNMNKNSNNNNNGYDSPNTMAMDELFGYMTTDDNDDDDDNDNTMTTLIPSTTFDIETDNNVFIYKNSENNNKNNDNNNNNDDDNENENIKSTKATNHTSTNTTYLLWVSQIEQHKTLNLNLWHIEFCEKNKTNISLYRVIYTNNNNNTNGKRNGNSFFKRRALDTDYLTYAQILEIEKLEEESKESKERKEVKRRLSNIEMKSGTSINNPFIVGYSTYNNLDVSSESTLFDKLVNKVKSTLDSIMSYVPLISSNIDNNSKNDNNNNNNEFFVTSGNNDNLNNIEISSMSYKHLLNSTFISTNETCKYKSYAEYDASSTQQLSLWFIVLVIALLFACFICLLCSHPLFDACHYKDERERLKRQRAERRLQRERERERETQRQRQDQSQSINNQFANVIAGASLQNIDGNLNDDIRIVTNTNNKDVNDNNMKNSNNANANGNDYVDIAQLSQDLDFMNRYNNLNEQSESSMNDNNGNNNSVNSNSNNNNNNSNNNININNDNNNENDNGNLNNNNGNNDSLRSSIQKLLAFAITILCACILNWSSFVFAAVYESERNKYIDDNEIDDNDITQSNLGTGMLSVNLAMLLTIILAVIHCGSPQRVPESSNENNNNNNSNNNNNNNNNSNNNNNNAINISNDHNVNNSNGIGIDSETVNHNNAVILNNLNGLMLTNHGNNYNNINNNSNNNNSNNDSPNGSLLNDNYHNSGGNVLECDIPSNRSPASLDSDKNNGNIEVSMPTKLKFSINDKNNNNNNNNGKITATTTRTECKDNEKNRERMSIGEAFINNTLMNASLLSNNSVNSNSSDSSPITQNEIGNESTNALLASSSLSSAKLEKDVSKVSSKQKRQSQGKRKKGDKYNEDMHYAIIGTDNEDQDQS